MNDTPLLEGAFTPFVAEQIGWYVYVLQDPRDGKIFYIGKGKGNRVFAHALDVKTEGEVFENPKHELIRSILMDGLKVNSFLIRHGISSEKDAYAVEAALIDFCHLLDSSDDNELFQLKNLVRGHNYQTLGVMATDVVISLYDAPPCPLIEEPMLLFKIPIRWRPEMTPEELFESTRGWWRLSPRREKAVYACAVSKGVIRGIYRIDRWRPRVEGDRDWENDSGKKPRWGFCGEIAPEMDKYLNKSVAHLFKQGEAGGFKYINC